MKSIVKILKYVKSYWEYAVLNVLFNILSILFSVVSLTMIIPFLGLLFGTQDLVYSRSPLELNTASIIENFYYLLSKIIVEQGKANALLFICIIVIILFFLKNLFRYLALYTIAPIRNGVVRDIRNEVYNKLLALPLSYYTKEKKGDIIARMTTDSQEVESSIMLSLEIIFKEPLTIIAFLSIMIIMSPQLSVFVLVLLPITGYIIGRVGKSLKKISAKGQAKMGQLLSVIEETLTGMRIIKAFTAEELSSKKFQLVNNSFRKLNIKMARKRDLSSPMSEFLGIGVLVIVMWFGGKLVLDADKAISAEVFIAYIAIFSQIISPAKSFASAYYNIQKGSASLDRIEEVLNAEETIKEKADAKAIKTFESEIEFKNVSFAYDTIPTLTSIDLKIPRGKTIALIGQSGGGKTTLANLLPRF